MDGGGRNRGQQSGDDGGERCALSGAEDLHVDVLEQLHKGERVPLTHQVGGGEEVSGRAAAGHAGYRVRLSTHEAGPAMQRVVEWWRQRGGALVAFAALTWLPWLALWVLYRRPEDLTWALVGGAVWMGGTSAWLSRRR